MKGDHLGEFEFVVLAAVMRVGGGAYGVRIRQVIEESIDRRVSMGAVYATLDRLDRKGYVSSEFGDPTPERGGKAKRYFRVEASGAAALRRSLDDHQTMTEGLDLEPAT